MFGLIRSNLVSSIKPTTIMTSSVPVLSSSTFGSSFSIFKRFRHEYSPRVKVVRKAQKGRVSVRTGGSIKGNSLAFGKLGLRLKSNGIRFNANQLLAADKVLKRELRPSRSQLITRFVCDLAVCVKGNQTRMGKGKGSFDHWACRVPTGKVLFEIKGDIHDKIAREALRKAAAKLPGLFEIIDEKSKIRVSPTCLIDKPEPINYEEKFNENPSKKWKNIQENKNDSMYTLYSGR
ncbi:mrpl16 [[Candida] subhashii]|uniref:Mrpl16 n=1 Tax=[Candida] subhashii TaxID=561895 RepID=A0A8J5QT51_9ASCO|nr:mrpl16 [[Candida] subhashii]KAG7664702.1 mrpl16 [[Candida] subhashii]